MADTTTATKNSASKTEPKFKFGELVQWQPIGGDEWYHGVVIKAEWQEKEYSYTIYHDYCFMTKLETQRGSTYDDAYYHIVTESMVTLKKESVSGYLEHPVDPPRKDWPDSESEADEDTSVTIEPKAKPVGSKRKATGEQAERKKVKTLKYKQDDRSRKWHCTPKVKVLDPKKEFDKYGPHCLNEKYYAKAVSGKAIEVIDVSDKDERLQALSLAVDKGAITDLALSGTDLLVGIANQPDGYFEATHDVKLYDLTYRKNPHIIWEQREQRKWQFGPVLDFGFCSYRDSVAEPYILCKKKLVFPRLSHSFAFGELEAGPEVLIAPDRLRVYNLKKEKTYYTRSFDDETPTDKEQVGAYACIDKSGTYAVLSRPDSGRYFIQDLQTERNIGHTGFAPTFIAKNEDGFFVLCDTGDCYQMIGKKNYYSTHVRIKGVDHMAVYNYGDRVKCVKMTEYRKLQTLSFPEA